MIPVLRISDLTQSRAFFVLIVSLVVLGVIGVGSSGIYNVLPADQILEAALIVAALIMLRLPVRGAALFGLASAFYVLICGFIAIVLHGANILDFLQAYKAFIYIPIVSPFVGRPLLRARTLRPLFWILITLFLIKYSYSRAFGGGTKFTVRPGLYMENNFELVFLLLLYYLTARSGEKFLAGLIALSLAVLLSGSRSAVLGLLVVFGALQLRSGSVKQFLITLLAAPPLIVAVSAIFESRSSGGIENIDRFKFLLIFMDEIKNWSLHQYLFGTPPITPLSTSACAALSFWQNLFSYSDDGTCYSVILHSYLLRVIFDHGVVGFVFLLSFIWWSLKRSGNKPIDRLAVMGVLLVSALSVSSFNNIFAALSLAFFFSSGYSNTSTAINLSESRISPT